MEARQQYAGRHTAKHIAGGRVHSRLRFCEINELEKLKWKKQKKAEVVRGR